MNTSDFITAFLNNEMTPEQERQFLVSVASSDSMRLALKSHVILDRMLSGQLQRATVPEAVRTTIFAAASASMAEPVGAPLSDAGTLTQPRPVGRAAELMRRASRPLLVALLTVLGFSAGYVAGNDSSSPEAVNANNVTPATQPVQTQTPAVASPAAPAQQFESTAQQETASPSIDVDRSNVNEIRSTASAQRRVAPHTEARPSVANRTDRNVEPTSSVDQSEPAHTPTQATTQQPAGTSPSAIGVILTTRKPSDSERTTNRGGHQGNP